MSPVSRTVLHVLKQSVSGTLLFLLVSKDRNQIAHEWLAAKKRGGEGRGGDGEKCGKRKGISFSPSEPVSTNWFLLALFSWVLLRVCAVKECSLEKKKIIYYLTPINAHNNKSQNFKFVKCWGTSHSTLRCCHIGTLWYFTCHRTLPSTVELQ